MPGRKQVQQQPRPQKQQPKLQQQPVDWRLQDKVYSTAQRCDQQLSEMQETLQDVLNRLATVEAAAAQSASKVEQLESDMKTGLNHFAERAIEAQAARAEFAGGATQHFYIGDDSDEEGGSTRRSSSHRRGWSTGRVGQTTSTTRAWWCKKKALTM